MNKMPLLGVGFCVAALAITGVPPFNGFFSKFPIFAAGFALSHEFWLMTPLMVLVLIESVASFAWFIYWFGRVIPGKPSDEVAQCRSAAAGDERGVSDSDRDVGRFQRDCRRLAWIRELLMTGSLIVNNLAGLMMVTSAAGDWRQTARGLRAGSMPCSRCYWC
ncbi:Mrp complex subunit D1 [Serratia fonticola]|uniref:Mrp complex subunit D1 n=1 Tax=Serratia fonticola TaxID=47917 RepID=A0A4U9TBG1_SERFO|nr:Mrp complex subunit D1 [Serratia fonticola]